ncbi:GNAT family N-acetyltransferase [Flavivirga abyssicola]|uniref:GNAT family N-acetyltransferase n=1 Tax=Flavivirga abyssicola TaxID=3063533 RepID=UPI0026E003C3|nr:GNAT family N-acetyltransferase [Flavivirga sp. MEBiC07777]WVK12999.1 GNAT family N-acetyltransferase [Flavivirga sp. MEBiC07777]
MLKKILPESLDVLSTFLERKVALPIYSAIINNISGTPIYKNTKLELKDKSFLYCIYDFPSYLSGTITNTNWKLKIINTYKGSLILLKNYKGTDHYLKHKFSSGRRSKFRTYQRRLETCFDIEYKSYFGAISKDEYDFLFETFHKMIKNRFLEKKIQNYDLSRWDIYYDIAYPLINSKEAALFVIYNDKKPISICLNLVRNKTIYGYVRTYDIDYSKFYIGFTDFIKQLDWCFDNKIEIFDLLKGNYPYKTKLIDTQYNFQKHILYNSKSILASISANLIVTRTRVFYTLVRFLKKLNFNILYHNFLKYRYRNRELSNMDTSSRKIVIEKLELMDSNANLTNIDINNETFSHLKRPVYNFLYANQESINTIEVFKFQKERDVYIIKGKNNISKITFQ